MAVNRLVIQWALRTFQFAKSKGEAMTSPYEYTQVVTLDRTDDQSDPHYLVYSYADSTPSISVASVMDEVKEIHPQI